MEAPYASGPADEVNSIIWPNPIFDNNITVYGPQVKSLAGRYLAQMIEELKALPDPDEIADSLLDSIDLIVPQNKALFPAGTRNLHRSEDVPFRVGEEIQTPGMRVTVLAVGPQGPREVRFVFDRDLDEKPGRWFTENFEEWREATLPPVGFGAPFDP